jgi:hypothetical protein
VITIRFKNALSSYDKDALPSDVWYVYDLIIEFLWNNVGSDDKQLKENYDVLVK